MNLGAITSCTSNEQAQPTSPDASTSQQLTNTVSGLLTSFSVSTKMADECDQQENVNAPNGPHLLTLPLEIRYEIYQYLHRSFFIIANATGTLSGFHYLFICINDAPLLNVLLASSQLRDEYQNAACFRDLRLTIKGTPGRFDGYLDTDMYPAHPAHITLLVKINERSSTLPTPSMKQRALQYIRAFQS